VLGEKRDALRTAHNRTLNELNTHTQQNTSVCYIKNKSARKKRYTTV